MEILAPVTSDEQGLDDLQIQIKAEPANAKRIRKRLSYLMFREMANFLLSSPSVEDVLRYVHGLLNDKSAYGSMTAAGYAGESLDLVVSEVNNGR